MSNLPSLLPPNTTEAERALEQVQARPSLLPVPLRELWNSDTCPLALLPWLAWTVSIDDWKPYWPEAVKRERIRHAVEIQRRKGTVKSVRDVVSALGSALALREWWQLSPAGDPHTFEVVLALGAGVPNAADYQQDVIREIERTKPVRSHFTFTIGLAASGGLGLQGAANPIVYRRLQFTEAP
jgi:phage tail P2-like protein